MIISTWNVNSIKVRLPNVLQYLSQYYPDVLVLQETKSIDENFPEAAISEAGYYSSFCGQKTYNGVAILSKDEPHEIIKNPVFLDKGEMRSLYIKYNGVGILNVYVVNGKDVESDKYEYKLKWLSALKKFCKQQCKSNDKFIVLGDFNIAPTNKDVFDVDSTKDKILCSKKERTALKDIMDLGLYDLFYDYNFPDQTFTWWDYRGGAFHRNIGFRIDIILGSKKIKDLCESYFIDKDTRHKSWCKSEPRTSDHVPVRIKLSK